MGTDYCDAAYRHFGDASHLAENKSVPNADHLYGVAAECALKAVMIGLGAPSGGGELQEKSHRQHIDKLWSEYESFVKGRSAARYLTPLAGLPPGPFSDWRIEQRYSHRTDVSSTKVLGSHAKAAKACLVTLERAINDGRVRWIR